MVAIHFLSMQLKAIALILIYFGILGSSALAQNPGDRIWTGKNGATFRGVYVETLENGGKIRFLTNSGKMLLVAFGNLIETDQKIILGIEGKKDPAEKKKKRPFDPDAFKELPIADRGLIPERKPEDFGGTDDESLVDALWVSLLWWNAFEVMPIPKTGDFERKAEWLHKELTRYVAKGGKSSATLEETKEGIEEYFSKRLEQKGTVRATVLSKCLEPADLALLTEGNQIVILKLAMQYSNDTNYSVAAALEKVAVDGTFSFHVFGNRYTGKLVVVPGQKAANPAYENGKPKIGKVYEFVLNDRDSLPKHYFDHKARFFINQTRWGGAMVLEPYVYKVEGEPTPLPDQ